jgi:hypothetical protein
MHVHTAIDAIEPAHTGQQRPLADEPKPLPFEYQPLSLDADAFRLVKILPGSDETIIRCNMRNTNIHEEHYFCFSYTWELKNPSHEIEINGRIATIARTYGSSCALPAQPAFKSHCGSMLYVSTNHTIPKRIIKLEG